jgi:hypothetical protein
VGNLETDPPSKRFNPTHRSYCISTILCAVAFLEALVNELLKDAADGHTSYLDSCRRASASAEI